MRPVASGDTVFDPLSASTRSVSLARQATDRYDDFMKAVEPHIEGELEEPGEPVTRAERRRVERESKLSRLGRVLDNALIHHEFTVPDWMSAAIRDLVPPTWVIPSERARPGGWPPMRARARQR